MTTTKYDWKDFFRPVAEKLCELPEQGKERDSEMVKLATEIFGEEGEIVKPEYLENGIDPFSFVYSLAVKSADADEQRKKCAKILLKDESRATITDEEYPHPIHKHLFHQFGRRCQTENNKPENNTPKTEQEALDQLWKLFHDCYNAEKYYDIGDERIRKTIQGICGVGLVNLTHTLFLINPNVFLPIDNRTLHLSANKDIRSMSEKEIRKQIEKDKWQFSGVMDSLLKQFPGCLPYEFNLFGYLIKKEKIKLQQKYWLISSNAKNDDKDWWEGEHTQDAEQQWSFRDQSCVWTSRPDDGGGNPYPVQKPERGDIMFCRIGPTTAHGIGIVTDNGYSNGWKKDVNISVIWIAAAEHNIEHMGPQPGLTTGGSYINRYKKAYPKTFELLERLQKTGKLKQDKINKMKQDTQKNIILTGPPGTGKTRLAKQLAVWLCAEGNEVNRPQLSHWLQDKVTDNPPEKMTDEFDDLPSGRAELVQFHPSYNYEDFVRGIVAETGEGKITYEVQDKILAKLAKRAAQDIANPYVLIIDEINRANLSSVLGELIYALEYRGEPVQTLYPIPKKEEPEQDDHTLIIPHNLYIIGTMNTADRSVGFIDYAIRRRFIFRKVLADKKIIEEKCGKGGAADTLYGEVKKLFKDHISSEFNQEDMMIGHSYFIPRDVEKTTDLGLRLEYEIKPLLEEYVRDGILLEEHVGDDNPTDKDRKTKTASEKIKELKTS